MRFNSRGLSENQNMTIDKFSNGDKIATFSLKRKGYVFPSFCVKVIEHPNQKAQIQVEESNHFLTPREALRSAELLKSASMLAIVHNRGLNKKKIK
jgi:hypothetical protein